MTKLPPASDDCDRVLYDDIEYTDDGFYFYESLRFTGVGYEEDDGGELICEIYFVNGVQHGPARDYYPSGQVKGEIPYKEGLKHGIEHEWYEDGRLREEKEFEFDVLMRSKTWSRDGALVRKFERPSEDHLYRLVLERRGGDD